MNARNKEAMIIIGMNMRLKSTFNSMLFRINKKVIGKDKPPRMAREMMPFKREKINKFFMYFRPAGEVLARVRGSEVELALAVAYIKAPLAQLLTIAPIMTDRQIEARKIRTKIIQVLAGIDINQLLRASVVAPKTFFTFSGKF